MTTPMAPESAHPPHAVPVQVRGSAALVVLATGAGTTALALGGVWALATFSGENVMGWYANYVLPVGAVLVGLVASSGFGLAAYLGGTKITGRLLLAVAAILVAGYWGAQLLQFHLAFPDGAYLDDGTRATFFDYYDVVTRGFAWEENGKTGAELGAWGYLLRAGEVLGFALGGLIIPLAQKTLPYCASCGVYMRRPLVAVLPASLAPKRIATRNAEKRAERERQDAEVLQRAEKDLERIAAAARSGDEAGYAAAVGEGGSRSGKRAAEKAAVRLHVRLVHCRRCGAGELRVLRVVGRGRGVKSTPHASHPLERGVARRLLGAGTRARAKA
jgi:hypothetical protein